MVEKNIRYKYQTIEFDDEDIHLRTLKDTQQFSDKNNIAKNLGISSAVWPLFGVVWPSGEVLANFIQDYDFKNKRILEVGCGIGLSSLILNKLDADITATDYHPEAENFLDINTELNNDEEIPFVRVDWNKTYSEKLGKFDLIIGSDLLYERDHVELLSSFINAHSNQKCTVILVNPNRGHQSKFNQEMENYGFSLNAFKPENTDFLDEPYKGKIFEFKR
ncbi:class I SAM-dependent methyltransferase [Aliarcobacter thereius]|uniref:Bifunctional 3-demethylubiquinone-9 3-methyltransferase/ 2-octaprenyl-6-hydroxy phenol methylase n=2 Tax=Aliarcobacter thereius TaxID=544718 RepID=A0A1C0B7M8_9BACT|nr:methyltransferase domain-containing protein [Aliarcobacter thereius]OCL95507.1 bifunctional 3-demethylubiquinone-9 3-methyltransferase/ 2-octaprenyl-6-hydroxy phenol methylase [Aliarcobacter thereius LMG 24486]OCL99583.1 bifunctional 3-demethylubiquinone-9 3-methyltransferase/ 2-octaprenyl-6-hydroxy phenol methylase [Aliarcobacter thereius]QBF16506.1 SAM-dependent methyltransferase [Aliarcobacter thereius LMG 24486]TLS93767.1 methyltransferase domain-containing protein [Aliarcobacter thereiu